VGTSYCCESLSFTIPLSGFGRPGTNLVCESVDRFRGWSRDLVIRECGDSSVSGSPISTGPKLRERYLTRVEVHQERLEPVMS